jgi:two-component system chemotaxis sensor kinase CheA
MHKALEFLVLPKAITEFEARYLARVNRVALFFFAAHIPVFALIAWLNATGPAIAALLATLVVVGPAIAHASLKNPRHVSMVHGVAAMFMGGLLVHFGQGPVQIEMHFYFFSLVAMCAVFGNPLVIVGAAVTVALHHLVVWLVLPRSVFNYDAEWWVVGVHAAFVVLESAAACFIARSFFDNVIGLEAIVQARTEALDAKNREMRLLLDNVQQGFLTIDARGELAPERSAAADAIFGTPEPGMTWFDMLAKLSPELATSSRVAWEEVAAGIMPAEVTLDQMPRRLDANGIQLRIEYRPIGAAEPYERYLVVVTDVTKEVGREAADLERREAMAVFERVLVDRSGFEVFFEEAAATVDALVTQPSSDDSHVKRLLHTLKGNASLYGLASIADRCHALEELIVTEGELPPPAAYADLHARWSRLSVDIEKLLGGRAKAIELSEEQHAELEAAVRAETPHARLLQIVRALRLEPTSKRLRHFGDQAQRIAERLDKGQMSVSVEDNGVRLDARQWAGFWSTFIHAVRNAVDHGIESQDARVAAGKPALGRLALRTFQQSESLVVEVADDGRGIDWSAVAEKAARIGLPAASESDLEVALFADGLSTAARTTDVSGRGVGMGALLHGTRALGGRISIDSAEGRGTVVRMTFPLTAASSSADAAA